MKKKVTDNNSAGPVLVTGNGTSPATETAEAVERTAKRKVCFADFVQWKVELSYCFTSYADYKQQRIEKVHVWLRGWLVDADRPEFTRHIELPANHPIMLLRWEKMVDTLPPGYFDNEFGGIRSTCGHKLLDDIQKLLSFKEVQSEIDAFIAEKNYVPTEAQQKELDEIQKEAEERARRVSAAILSLEEGITLGAAYKMVLPKRLDTDWVEYCEYARETWYESECWK